MQTETKGSLLGSLRLRLEDDRQVIEVAFWSNRVATVDTPVRQPGDGEQTGWWVRMLVRPQDDHLGLVATQVFPWRRGFPPKRQDVSLEGDGSGGVLPITAMRRFPWGATIRETEAAMASMVDWIDSGKLGGTFHNPWAPVAERFRPKRPGRGGRPDEFYARLARRYIEVCESGSTRPGVDLAEAECVSAGTLAQQIHEARRRGVLSKTARGVAGGYLTEYGRELLGLDDEET